MKKSPSIQKTFSAYLIINNSLTLNSVIFFPKDNMFDLNQASYLVRRKEGESSLSYTPEDRSNVNGSGRDQPCNSLLDQIQS